MNMKNTKKKSSTLHQKRLADINLHQQTTIQYNKQQPLTNLTPRQGWVPSFFTATPGSGKEWKQA